MAHDFPIFKKEQNEGSNVFRISKTKYVDLIKIFKKLSEKKCIFINTSTEEVDVEEEFLVHGARRIQLLESLGLSGSATKSDVKKKYRELSLLHHPDKGGNLEKMKEINIAKEQLIGGHVKNFF